MKTPMQRMTADGFDVPTTHSLDFTLATCQETGWDGTLLRVTFEWQQDENKRRPYLAIEFGPWTIQSGWLWNRPDVEEPK